MRIIGFHRTNSTCGSLRLIIIINLSFFIHNTRPYIHLRLPKSEVFRMGCIGYLCIFILIFILVCVFSIHVYISFVYFCIHVHIGFVYFCIHIGGLFSFAFMFILMVCVFAFILVVCVVLHSSSYWWFVFLHWHIDGFCFCIHIDGLCFCIHIGGLWSFVFMFTMMVCVLHSYSV